MDAKSIYESKAKELLVVGGGKNHWLKGGQRRIVNKITTFNPKKGSTYSDTSSGLSVLELARGFVLRKNTVLASFPTDHNHYRNEVNIIDFIKKCSRQHVNISNAF